MSRNPRRPAMNGFVSVMGLLVLPVHGVPVLLDVDDPAGPTAPLHASLSGA